MKGYKHTMGKNAVDFNSIAASSVIVGSDGVKLEENPSSFPSPSLLNNRHKRVKVRERIIIVNNCNIVQSFVNKSLSSADFP